MVHGQTAGQTGWESQDKAQDAQGRKRKAKANADTPATKKDKKAPPTKVLLCVDE